jgi:hypothetical protein
MYRISDSNIRGLFEAYNNVYKNKTNKLRESFFSWISENKNILPSGKNVDIKELYVLYLLEQPTTETPPKKPTYEGEKVKPLETTGNSSVGTGNPYTAKPEAAKPAPTPAPATPKPASTADYMKAAAAARKSGDPAEMARVRDMGMEIWRKSNPRLAEVERLRQQQKDSGKSASDPGFREKTINPVMYGKKSVETSKKENPPKTTPTKPTETPTSVKASPAPTLTPEQQKMYKQAYENRNNPLAKGRIKDRLSQMTPEQRAQFKKYAESQGHSADWKDYNV